MSSNMFALQEFYVNEVSYRGIIFILHGLLKFAGLFGCNFVGKWFEKL